MDFFSASEKNMISHSEKMLLVNIHQQYEKARDLKKKKKVLFEGTSASSKDIGMKVLCCFSDGEKVKAYRVGTQVLADREAFTKNTMCVCFMHVFWMQR